MPLSRRQVFAIRFRASGAFERRLQPSPDESAFAPVVIFSHKRMLGSLVNFGACACVVFSGWRTGFTATRAMTPL